MFGYHRHGRSFERGIRTVIAACSITAGSGQEPGIPPLILDGLSAEKFAEREMAQDSLRQWAAKTPEKAINALLKKARDAEDPEIRSRCSDMLKEIVLEREYRADGFLGISMQEVEVKLPGGGKSKAIRVTRVIENSSAGQAGITEGALIVGLGERMWKEGEMAMEFREQVKGTRPGTMLTLQLLEDGEIIRKVLELGGRPPQTGGVDEEDPVKANERAREEFFRKWLDRRTKQLR
jgi:predicted metalloprotease with PDZ domain